MKESEIRPADLFNQYLALAREDCNSLLANRQAFVDVDCPACGETQRSIAFEKLGFNYALCAACETLYVSPRPSPELLEEFYSHGKSVAFWSSHFYKETYEARREKLFRPRADLVAKLVGKYEVKTASIIDLGCGYGTFLEEMQRLKLFDGLIGIEPNKALAEICKQKGFRVVESHVEEVPEGTVRAGCVTGFEILEHVFEPLEFLKPVRHLLDPAGVLLLTTLTVSGFDIQVLWEHSKSVHPPHHLNLFSLSGLERLMERAGLQILDMSTPGRLDVDIVANAVRENPQIPIPRVVTQILRGDSQTLNSFQEFLRSNRLSSHVQVVARVAAAA